MSAPEFVDFAAYARGVYTPPPALVAIGHEDAFWRTLEGSTVDPWGDGGETMRQRDAAADLRSVQ